MAEFLFDNIIVVALVLTSLIMYLIFRVSMRSANKTESSVNDLILSSYPDAIHLHYFKFTQQAFAISNASQCVVLARDRSLTTIPYKELAGVEVVVNGGTVASTSASDVVGRAIVGGVVGALTAKRVTSKTAYDIHVNIRTSNLSQPTARFDLLNFEMEYFDKEVDEATECANIVKLLIDQNQPVPAPEPQPSKPEPVPSTPHSTMSVADELRKLADLHTQGILTEAEFQDQKKRLLS